MDATALWYGLIFGLIGVYALLDGFDLGVGIIHPLANSRQRFLIMRAIGPFYDGNEVWLIIFEQALMAIFPAAYAAIFSGFYFPILILTASLVLRVCAMEFRHSSKNLRWTTCWDWIFFTASLTAALSLGAMLGYLALGIPLTVDGDFDEVAMKWLRLLPMLTGCSTVVLFALHGASYLLLKIRGPFQNKIYKWALAVWTMCPILAAAIVFNTLAQAPHFFVKFRQGGMGSALLLSSTPLFWGLYLLSLIKTKFQCCFLCSGGMICSALALFATGQYPNLVLASNDKALSITALNAISSPLSREYLAVALSLGLPLVLGYTAVIYWLLREPIRDDQGDYYL